jgi:hypothetical protein
VVLYQAELHPDYGGYLNQAGWVLKEPAYCSFAGCLFVWECSIIVDLLSSLTMVETGDQIKQRSFRMKGRKWQCFKFTKSYQVQRNRNKFLL